MGQLAVDDERPGRRPAILVSHEGNGLSDHSKRSARRLAELGYVAFAPTTTVADTMLPPEELPARFTALAGDPLKTRAIAQAGLDVLLSRRASRPGPGGGDRLLLRRHDRRSSWRAAGPTSRAVVGFHSGLVTRRPEDAANIKAAVLVCIGADDPLIPPDQRVAFEEEMRVGGVDWRMNLYGGAVHSFTNPAADGTRPGIKYEAKADARSWRAMLDFFHERFGPI